VTQTVDRASHGVEESNDTGLVSGDEAGGVRCGVQARNALPLVVLFVLELGGFPQHEVRLFEYSLPESEEIRSVVFSGLANRDGWIHAA
jgi:hypothetical protein